MTGYWISFALIFPLVLLGVPYIKIKATKSLKTAITPEMDKRANARVIRYILFYWLCNLFYMACFIDNIVCKYIFGGLIMVIIFRDLAISVSSAKEKNPVVVFGLIQDFLAGIGLSIYLIYIIPNDELKTIVIPIVAAIFGGLITLEGVLLTIRKSESAKKEEEIKKAQPFILVLDQRSTELNKYNIKAIKDLYSDEQIGTLQEANNESCYWIHRILLSNTDCAHAMLIGFRINKDYHLFDLSYSLPKNTFIYFRSGYRFKYDDEIKYVALLVKDMLDNLYELEVKYTINNGEIILIDGLNTKKSDLSLD